MKRRSRLHQWPGLAVLFAVLAATSASALDLATTPQSVPTPVAPNVILTLDDSDSMALAVLNRQDNYNTHKWGERFFKSSHFNPLYYDPSHTYLPPLDADGKPLTTSFNQAYINGFDPSRGSIDLATEYRPVHSYEPRRARNPGSKACTGQTFQTFANHYYSTDDTAKDGFTSPDQCENVAAYYYVFNAKNADCDGTDTDEDCYTKVTVTDSSGPGGTDERQNFANWYSFYRTRNLLTVTAASRAFSGLDGKIRMAWQAINSCTAFDDGSCKGWNGAGVKNRLDNFSGDHKKDFYNWLFRLPATGVTPLRSAMIRAGTYFSNVDAYRDDPTKNDSPVRSCRDNFHVLMTDGEWNSDGGLTSPGNADNIETVLPDNRTYVPQPPFKDNNSNNLADIAFKYWASDLTNLTNNLLPSIRDKLDPSYWNPKNDPATWQHMVNFTVGLALKGSLGPNWDGSTYTGAYPRLKDGSMAWPATGPNITPGNVYDLWHAALNSRGEFFAADDAGGIQTAFNNIFNRIVERKSAAAALVANSTRLDAGTVIFQALFYTSDWHGELIATAVNNDGTTGKQLWTATIPDHVSRKLYTWNDATKAGSLFTWDGLSEAQQAAIVDDIDDATPNAQDGQVDNAAEAQAVLAWLRGDRSQEQQVVNGVASGKYRARGALLGDIVNSDPAYVAASNYGYARLPEGADTANKPYKKFVEANKKRTRMLYVGANDGMLHAFRADNGEEKFAYVPAALIPELARLSDPGYTHRYYVDGSPHVGDAFLGGAWKTVLLGSTGAGGRVVFALDITDPDQFDAGKVMWEFSAANDSDLGYTIGQAVIARLNNGKWAAVFGNGYNSDNGHAVLFIVDLETGALIKKFDVNAGQDKLDNGLASPALYDANGDGITDYVYAGDNEGRLWKFRLTDEADPNDANYVPAPGDPNRWGVAYAGNPLFVARYANGQSQPISAPLDLGDPPPGRSGVMVYFGTGRFVATGDKVDKTVQSFYGILDDGSAIVETDRSGLQRQAILYQGSLGGRKVRATENRAVDYASQRGWYMDLIYDNRAEGERVVSAPQLRHGRVIFTTMLPSEDPCKAGGESWIMELAAVNGGANEAVFDIDGNPGWDSVTFMVDGQPVTVPVTGVQSGVGVIKGVAVITGAIGEEFKLGSGSNEANIEAIKEKGSGGATGRVSWREIVD